MKIYNWKDCIQDRHKWEKVVEKAKTFNDWSCRAWRRRSVTFSTTDLTLTGLGSNPSLHSERPASNRLAQGTANFKNENKKVDVPNRRKLKATLFQSVCTCTARVDDRSLENPITAH
jgi:hypothetical protein